MLNCMILLYVYFFPFKWTMIERNALKASKSRCFTGRVPNVKNCVWEKSLAVPPWCRGSGRQAQKEFIPKELKKDLKTWKYSKSLRKKLRRRFFFFISVETDFIRRRGKTVNVRTRMMTCHCNTCVRRSSTWRPWSVGSEVKALLKKRLKRDLKHLKRCFWKAILKRSVSIWSSL